MLESTDTNSGGLNLGGMLVSKRVVVMRAWREHLANMQKFKDGCFQVLAHPDSKPEDLEALRRLAKNITERHTDMLNTMRSKGYNV